MVDREYQPGTASVPTAASLPDRCQACGWISANVNNPHYLSQLRPDQRAKHACPNCGWRPTLDSSAASSLLWPKECPGCLGWSHTQHRYDATCELMPIELHPARTCLRCGHRSVAPHGGGYSCRDCGTEEKYDPPNWKEGVMDDAAEKAVEVLTEIAQDKEVEPDTRIRAAATILDLVKFREGVPA